MKFGYSIGIFLSSAHLICRSTDISKYFRGSLRLRDNESRLYIFFWNTVQSDLYHHCQKTPWKISSWARSSLIRVVVVFIGYLNVYCEIFGTSSYGEGRTSLRVHFGHMNECRIFHNIHSITCLLYTFYSNCLVSSVHLHKKSKYDISKSTKKCFNLKLHYAILCLYTSLKPRPKARKWKWRSV